MTTIYRTCIKNVPGTDDTPEYWRVELLTHTEDGPQVEFVGEFFEESDAELIMAAWRSEKTRAIVWLCGSLMNRGWDEDVE